MDKQGDNNNKVLVALETLLSQERTNNKKIHDNPNSSATKTTATEMEILLVRLHRNSKILAITLGASMPEAITSGARSMAGNMTNGYILACI